MGWIRNPYAGKVTSADLLNRIWHEKKEEIKGFIMQLESTNPPIRFNISRVVDLHNRPEWLDSRRVDLLDSSCIIDPLLPVYEISWFNIGKNLWNVKQTTTNFQIFICNEYTDNCKSKTLDSLESVLLTSTKLSQIILLKFSGDSEFYPKNELESSILSFQEHPKSLLSNERSKTLWKSYHSCVSALFFYTFQRDVE